VSGGRGVSSILVLLLGASLLGPARVTEPKHLRLMFIDVGQGDAALLVTPEGKTMLVDAGRNAQPVLDLLRANHIDTLDLIVVSHNHDDHMGGIPELLRYIAVRNYMDNGIPSARTYGAYLNAVRQSGARYLQATSRTITLGSVKIRVIPPPDPRYAIPQTDQNNHSIGLVIRYGAFNALLGGDSQREEIGYWLKVDSIPAVTVMKLNHHGSNNGTTRELAEHAAPRIAIISVGRNGYGHPGVAAVDTWCTGSAKVFRTDQNGTILITADSSGETSVRGARSRDTTLTSACRGVR
jgi:competence protein ComEC